jgi:2-polyprenyl-3-methyl-5-hydroxy-6-metoxy-1,4-benzoquinol methylase
MPAMGKGRLLQERVVTNNGRRNFGKVAETWDYGTETGQAGMDVLDFGCGTGLLTPAPTAVTARSRFS